MAKEDILLREVVFPPLTTTGAEMDFTQFDGNMITIFEQFVLLSQSSQVPAYDNAKKYSIGEYVSFSSQLWKMINGVPQTGVTPGTDPLTWLAVYASDMVQAPNPNAAGLIKKELIFDSAALLTLNGSASLLELIADPGADKYINLHQAILNLDFNSAFYEGFNSLEIGFTNSLGAGDSGLWEMDQALRAEVDQVRRFENKFPAYVSTDNFIVKNDSLSLMAVGGAPILGDSPIKINLTYEILDI
jgi:hypothetical protein